MKFLGYRSLFVIAAIQWVPVASAHIYPPNELYMKENHRQIIKCKTSACRPQPYVNWFLHDPNNYVKYNVTEQSSQTNSENDLGLIAAESVLHLLPNRSINTWIMYCEAWNQYGSSAIPSREIVLNVSYPPDSPIIYGYEIGKIFRVIESDRGEFSCSVTGGNPLATLNWKCFNSESTNMTIVNTTVILNVTWIAKRNTNVCSCEADHIFHGKQATNIDIDVLYPPTKPLLQISSVYVSDFVNIIQNNKLQVICESKSNPSLNYTWTGPYISSKMGQTLQILKIQREDEGLYNCTAANSMVRSDETYRNGRNTSSITVKVLYDPGQIAFIYGQSDSKVIKLNSIHVVKGDSFSIYCDADGFPTPSFNWDNYRSGHLLNIRNITFDTNKTCTATNMMNETVGESRIGKTSSTLSITVLYPPDVPNIKVSIGNDVDIATNERIDVIESETIYLECYSQSRPTPSYKWIVNKTNEVKGNVLTWENISRKDAGYYTCHVHNLMSRTFGAAEMGSNTSSRLLNILYPPDVESLIGRSLIERSTLNITCPVIPGNPMSTVVFWTRKRDSKQWNSSQLIILNVSRADDTVYTCTVSNEMIPTVGHAIKTTRNSEFHLNVFFSAEIKLFTVLGKDSSKEVIMINQKEEVAFICSTEANPAADISIRSPQYEHIAVVSSNNTLSHAIRNTSCVNAGEYMCTSRNNYTHGHASTSRLILIVRCAPKPSSDSIYGGKISSILHADVTLQFTAREYLDEPNKTTFIWFKDSTSIENDDSKFVMSSYGLQSNLSIRNITQSDFGQYELLVSNSVGQYRHSYQLMAKDKPEVPKGFGYMEYSITDSSVTITWSPGDNGGYPQLFLVFYKIITGQQWQNITIIDTGDIEMKHNLSGLLGMTEYQVKMFARNEEGDSDYTDSLQFITKAPASTVIESHSSSSLVIVAVTVPSVVIVTICGIIVVVLIYRKSLRQKHDRQTTRTVSTYEELDVNKREGDMYSQLPATYEQLNNDRQDKSMYMEMENVQMEWENPDYINIRI